MANVPFTPGSYGVQPTQYNYISLYDVVKPDRDSNLYKRWGDQYLTELLALVGREEVAENISGQHWEEDLIMPKISAASFTGGAPSGTITLATTSPTQNIGWPQASPYIGTALTNQGVPVREGDLIMIPPTAGTNVTASTYVRAYVNSVNTTAGTFTCYTLDGSNLPNIAANAEIIIYSNAHGEGSNQPRSLDHRIVPYTWQTQIFKNTYEYTGTAENLMLWLDQKWTFKGEQDALKIIMNQVEMGLVVGDNITNTTLANLYGTTPLQTSNGLINNILGGGITQGYTTVSGFGIPDIFTLSEQVDANKGAMENWLFLGIQLSSLFDQNIMNAFQNGAISYASFGNEGKEVAIRLGFSSVMVNNYVFHKKIYKPFNDPQMLGSVGYTWNQEGFMIPGDSGSDAKTGDKISSIAVRVRKNRGMVTNPVDLMKVGDDGADKKQVRYLSDKGLQTFGIGRFAYIFKQ